MDLFKVGSNIQSMQALTIFTNLMKDVGSSNQIIYWCANSAQDDTAGFAVAKNVETTQGYETSLQTSKTLSLYYLLLKLDRLPLELLQAMKDKAVQAQDTTYNAQAHL